jgi:hypothetical protein
MASRGAIHAGQQRNSDHNLEDVQHPHWRQSYKSAPHRIIRALHTARLSLCGTQPVEQQQKVEPLQNNSSLDSGYEGISSTIEHIDTSRAQGLLLANKENRRIDRAVVERYADAMRRGEWQLSHQGIAIDREGNLLDGQHRLNAIIKANLTVPMLVVTGVERRVFSVLDTGKRRSAADTLRLHGAVDPNHVAAALRYVHLFRTIPHGHWGGTTSRLTNDQIVELFLANPQMKECVRDSRQLSVSTGIIMSAAAAAIYLTRQAAPTADWANWNDGLLTGANLSLGDPRLAFRNFFANTRAQSGKRRADAQEHMAIYIRGWNYWVQGETRKYLQYRSGDPMPMPVTCIDEPLS